MNVPLLPQLDLSSILPDNPDDPHDLNFTYPLLYSSIVRASKNKSNYNFVEIGTFKGKSAYYMATEIKYHMLINSNKYKINFDTVDTFEGSEEHKEYLKNENISLHKTTKKQLEPLKDYVNIIKSDSVKNSSRYKDESLDFVFVDGDHSYDGVNRDINAYWKKLRIGGVMAGHDYDCGWFDVKNSVDDFFGENNLNLGRTMMHQGNESKEKYPQKYWNIGELCWGVIKTDTDKWKPLMSERGCDIIRNFSPSTWTGFKSQISNEDLMSLYNLENF
tara:strand:+ start:7135 stop:7959 length:825 start_codon:yes stop_codon:yes gene_type:complete